MSKVQYIVCDACGAQIDDDDVPGPIPVTIEGGDRQEEGHSVRRGDYCQECAPELLRGLTLLAKSWNMQILVGRVGGTAFLVDHEDDKERKRQPERYQ